MKKVKNNIKRSVKKKVEENGCGVFIIVVKTNLLVVEYCCSISFYILKIPYSSSKLVLSMKKGRDYKDGEIAKITF